MDHNQGLLSLFKYGQYHIAVNSQKVALVPFEARIIVKEKSALQHFLVNTTFPDEMFSWKLFYFLSNGNSVINLMNQYLSLKYKTHHSIRVLLKQ